MSSVWPLGGRALYSPMGGSRSCSSDWPIGVLHTGGFNVADEGFDRFGGWMGKRFAATGFFRVEKDDRWWLVSPEGNAFLSFGHQPPAS